MTERTEAEKVVRKLIAINDLKTPFSSIYQKINKTEKEIALGVANYVSANADFSNSVEAIVEYEEKMKTRGMREGIEEFKKRDPRHGAILEGLIQEKRMEREVYLRYGLKEAYKLNDNEYVSIIKSVGLSDEEAEAIFPKIMQFSERLRKKKDERLRSILVG